jgi:hypothetical protein
MTAMAQGQEQSTAGQSSPSSPDDVAQAYVAALDAANRAAANDLIADDGELAKWSRREFAWVGGFEIEYVGFQVVEKTGRDVIGEVELTIAETKGVVEYRFRETDSGWKLWEAFDGLRTNNTPGPADVASAYVAALDADNRNAANALIASDGELSVWSPQEFQWVGAFDIELVDFNVVERRDTGVIADLRVAIAGTTRTLRYEFRQVGSDGWKLWRSLTGLR